MIRGAILLAALLAAASASIIPFSLRQTIPRDVLGTFSSDLTSNPVCPKGVTHQRVPTKEGVIPHSSMIMNGNKCEGDGALTVIGTDHNEALKNTEDNGSEVAINQMNGSGETIIYAVEKEGRKCGDAELPPGTFVFIVNPVKAIRIFQSFSFPPNKRYMFIYVPGSDATTCFYNAELLTSPTPSPSAAPSITPEATPSTEDPDTQPPTTVPPPSTPIEGEETTEAEPIPTDGAEVDDDDTSPEATPDDGSVCFPADATVEMEDGSVKMMDSLSVGDRVKVGADKYSEVFMFTHKDAATRYSFVTLRTEAGASISATAGHYLYINDAFSAASTAKVGDTVQLGNGAYTVVIEVTKKMKKGLYNPQTLHGDIIVDSIRASTFTRTIVPTGAHAMLMPLRMMYSAIGWSTAAFDNGADMIASVLPLGKAAL